MFVKSVTKYNNFYGYNINKIDFNDFLTGLKERVSLIILFLLEIKFIE